MNKYENLRYNIGFLVTKQKSNLIELNKWKSKQNQHYYFYFHPSLDWSYADKDDLWICVLGRVIDISEKTYDLNKISHILLAQYEKSSDSFFNYVEQLLGRYVIIIGRNEDAIAFSDAIGMKAIFYNNNGEIASHAKLLSQVTNEIENERDSRFKSFWLRDYTAYQLPGNITPYSNIRQLIPNHTFNLKNNKINRYFPREELKHYSLDEAAQKIKEIVDKEIEIIEDLKFVVSLSGGMDSRTSLSFLKKHIKNTLFFTYYLTDSQDKNYAGNDVLNTDQFIVNNIKNNIPIDHQFIPIDISQFNNEDFREFTDIIRSNTYLSHNHKLAKLYYDNFTESNLIHIRSNSYEIGRALLRNGYQFNGKELTIENQVMSYSPKAVNDEEIRELVEEYNINFNPRDHFNYDPYDLLHWESRLGLWHSHVVIESDMAFDTHILINSHQIYKLLLSVPLSERKKGNLFLRIIEKNWPILRFWAINNRSNLLEKYDEQLIDYGLNLKESEIESGNIFDVTKSVPYFYENYVNSAKIYIDKSGPAKGDFVQFVKRVKVKSDAKQQLIIHLRSPFEAKHLIGRLKYEVLIQDKLVLEEDIALWKETNQIFIPINNQEKEIKVTIRVLSVKNCESWSLGKAGTLIIERMVLREVNEDSEGITFSSPYSKLV